MINLVSGVKGTNPIVCSLDTIQTSYNNENSINNWPIIGKYYILMRKNLNNKTLSGDFKKILNDTDYESKVRQCDFVPLNVNDKKMAITKLTY
jgi:hypothetical protein